MIAPEILNAVIGVSSFFGVVGLIAYLYFVMQIRHARFSVQGLLSGEQLFNADQILSILAQFDDDEKRLKALMALTNYSNKQANALLEKVSENIDVGNMSSILTKNYRVSALFSGIFFIFLACLALAYSKMSQTNDPDRQSIKALYGPTPIEPTATYSAKVAWVVERRAKVGHLRG